MQVVYAYEEMPERITKSLFLAGGTPRDDSGKPWRQDALKLLEDMGFEDGTVFVPEPRDGKWSKDYDAQIEWEEKFLNAADCVAFWVDRNLETLPCFTTNVEWGMWYDSGKAIFGAPPEAPKNNYLRYYANKFNVPVATTLTTILEIALERLGDGSIREGGERYIPLYIWKTPTFQAWYKAQVAAGNSLTSARTSFTIRPGNKDFVFLWGIHPEMHIGSEDRMKVNETVIARTDISSVLLWKPADPIDQSEIVLVKEYRVPATTEDAMIRELPGGSSSSNEDDPLMIAADEVREETGFDLSPDRLKTHTPRQLAGTLSAHKAHLFSAKLTEEEMDWFKSQKDIVHGLVEDGERTFIEVVKLKDIMKSNLLDWTTLGEILSVVCL